MTWQNSGLQVCLSKVFSTNVISTLNVYITPKIDSSSSLPSTAPIHLFHKLTIFFAIVLSL